MDRFVQWYNHEHRHSGIGLHTPADVFYGLAGGKDTQRRAVLADARARHPRRFGRDTAPKVIDLPESAAINPPKPDEQETETEAAEHPLDSNTLTNSATSPIPRPVQIM